MQKPMFLLAHGAYNTLIEQFGAEYDGIDFAGIISRVRAPTAVEKLESDFIIPSTYRHHDGRSHEAQRQRGQYRMLALDIDTGNHDKPAIVDAVHEITGRCAVIVYSSSSASKHEQKWRVLIPIKQILTGAEYEDTQATLFDLMAKRGIQCDPALARCGQPIYLPNIPPDRRKPGGAPAYYDTMVVKDRTLDLEGSRLEMEMHARQQREQEAIAQAAADRQARERERAARRLERPQEADPVDEFNSRHTIADLLDKYGYTRRGSSSHYRSPLQTSASFATRDYGSHWVSLSSTDAANGLGRAKTLGPHSFTWGDAFDLYAHFEHGGDMKAAVRAYGSELRAQTLLPAPAQPADSLDDFDMVSAPVDQEAAAPAAPEPAAADEFEDSNSGVSVADDGFDIDNTPDDIPAADPPHDPDAWPTPFTRFDASEIPRRRWVYGFDYIRHYVSVLASAGGIGKTSLVTVEALAIATGRELLGTKVKEQASVWLVNLEDPIAEMQMRTIAAMKHYGIKPADIAGKLFMDGEDTFELTLAAENRDGLLKNDAMLEAMIQRVRRHDIGVVIFDPFVSVHLVNENSNGAVQAVVAMLRKLARDGDCSVMLVHHVRKGNGDDASVESIRGAGALIGAARAARVVNRVAEDDALKLGVDEADARSIFRVDDGKANLAPPAHAAVYRRMISVEIDNGEWIGVCVPFEMPNAFDGLSAKDARKVQDAVAEAAAAGKPFRDNSQSAEWVGIKIAELLDLDIGDKAAKGRVLAILREWKKTGVLAVEKMRDERRGRDFPIIVVGERVSLHEL
jgi:archaellum biogenesis ATPase FlaH